MNELEQVKIEQGNTTSIYYVPKFANKKFMGYDINTLQYKLEENERSDNG